MKAVAFDYLAPRDVAGALAALAENGAKLMAGGQSLGPMLNLRLVRPRIIVDISRIAALRGMEERSDSIWVGAGVTHAEIEDRGSGMLRAVAARIADRSVRNRGTMAGSLAHADPAADWPLALSLLDATVHLRKAGGTRTVPVDSVMEGAFTTRLAEDELIEAIEVPKLSPTARWGYYKFCRKTGEFAEASAAILLDPERRVARVFLGALNGAPRACHDLANQLAQGGKIDAEARARAIATTAPDLDPIARRMHAGALDRAIKQVFP
jgi:carbon-monoxide dehydrogenase medium subunit